MQYIRGENFVKKMLIVFLFLIDFTACNVFTTFDTPSGDIQILDAAESCFNRGDFVGASHYYAELSNAHSDLITSETIFKTLDENGLGMTVFMQAVFANAANAGKLITSLAGTLSPSAGLSLRQTLFNAYQQALSIQGTQLRGMMRFLMAYMLTIELFGELAGKTQHGILRQADLVTTPGAAGCSAQSTFSQINVGNIAALLTNCGAPTGGTITPANGAVPLTLLSLNFVPQYNSVPLSYQMIHATLIEILNGLSLLASSPHGSFGSASQTLTNQLNTQFSVPGYGLSGLTALISDATYVSFYRWFLINVLQIGVL